jgi:hypothetical protein
VAKSVEADEEELSREPPRPLGPAPGRAAHRCARRSRGPHGARPAETDRGETELMRSIFYIVTTLIVMGMAFWAYRQNYETQDAMREASARPVADRRAARDAGRPAGRMGLSQPPRPAAELADLNFDRLGLLPLTPEQFGNADQVAFPPDPMIVITNTVDTVGNLEQFP